MADPGVKKKNRKKDNNNKTVVDADHFLEGGLKRPLTQRKDRNLGNKMLEKLMHYTRSLSEVEKFQTREVAPTQEILSLCSSCYNN